MVIPALYVAVVEGAMNEHSSRSIVFLCCSQCVNSSRISFNFASGSQNSWRTLTVGVYQQFFAVGSVCCSVNSGGVN